jgi:AraC-like DNA-binding protein/quercetin dioxygenase-like cupin family protein
MGERSAGQKAGGRELAPEKHILHDCGGKELLTLETVTVSKNFLYAPHTHSPLEISLVLDGRGVYRIEGRSYDMRPGDIFLISNTDLHNIIIEDDSALASLTLHFQSEFLWDLLGMAPDYRLLKVFFARNAAFQHRLDRSSPATSEVAKILIGMEREMIEKPLFYDLQVKIMMKSLLLLILRKYDYWGADARIGPITHVEAYHMKKVLGFIDDNISKKLTLKILSKQAAFSPTYFSALFKRYNGITLTKYITCRRVEKAIELIEATCSDLGEIARCCGYDSPISLNKAFKRVMGMSPAAFRKGIRLPPR